MMSHKHQDEGGAGEEHQANPRNRQQNGTAAGGDAPPVRRSWRPCQMLSPDGEPNHHHHHHHGPPQHHHPSGRGQPPRQRRRQGPGPGQIQGQIQGQVQGQVPSPASVPSRQDQGRALEAEARPVQHPRPGVTRYRRQGDPNPRVRVHRQRQPVREVEEDAAAASSSLRSPSKEDESGRSLAEVRRQRSTHAPAAEHSLDGASPNLTPVAMLTPTEHTPATTATPAADLQIRGDLPPSAYAQEALRESGAEEKEPEEREVEEDKEEYKEEDKEEKRLREEDRNSDSTVTYSDRSHGDTEIAPARNEEEEVVAEGAGPGQREDNKPKEGKEIYVTEGDDAVPGEEAEEEATVDLCSDTESAASLNMDGPPPLCSPTPPSSPDLGERCGLQEEPSSSPSPGPDNEALPEDDDDDDEEGSSECCSPSKSYTTSYPKTYADFYTESHQKSAPETVVEPHAEAEPSVMKSHPDSFPEPLRTSYPELHREPRRRPSRRAESGEAHRETNKHNVQKRAPVSPVECHPHAGVRAGRERGSHATAPAWRGRSVGCRLHHYDAGQSDGGESDDVDGTPVGFGAVPGQTRHEDARVKSPPSRQSGSEDALNEQASPKEARAVCLSSGEEEERVKEEGSGGDAISLAIKDIREAIEEVKTKTVRSPYTPDQPVEPVWVMRQEEDATSTQQQQHSPVSQSPSPPVSESPSHYSPAAPPQGEEPVSPVRADTSRVHHQQQHHHPGHAPPQQRDPGHPPPQQRDPGHPPPQQRDPGHPPPQQRDPGHPPPQQRDTARPPRPAYTQPQPPPRANPPAHQQPPHQQAPQQPQLRPQHDPRQQKQQHQHRQHLEQQHEQHHEQLQHPPYQQPPQPHQHQQPQSAPVAHQHLQPQPQSTPVVPQQPSVQEIRRTLPTFPTYVDVPGPCDPDDLIDGIIFAASYLGSTHLLSERTPTKTARMQQAQEAMSRVRAAQKQAKNRKKSPDGEVPVSAEVDLFMSTQRIKVLNADTQESMMDLPLRTISYIADIGNMVVLMARGKMVRSRSSQDQDSLDTATEEQTTVAHDDRRQYRMVCHVFESEDAQLIAQSIGQAFSVAYQEFLRANGIDPEDLSQREYSDLLNTQDMYNDDLIHFSKSENCKDVYIEKQKGEMLGVVIVESGWGSILPTVIIASLMHGGPAEKSSRLNIGDQIMTVNGTSLVGLPLGTCQSIIKGLKSQARIKLNIVRCPPVTMVLIRRPDLRYQLGFSVQNGIICSLMRGGIAERGGVRVGHRIIEINSQSVVATPHEKIVHILSNAVGEIHMKTMPAAMYRLLTAQEHPVYI